MESLLSRYKCCYVCGTTMNLHKHHVYGGTGRRQSSDREGCGVWLCADHHNMSRAGVHQNHKLDNRIKVECQEAWEARTGRSREEFIKTFGRNYL